VNELVSYSQTAQSSRVVDEVGSGARGLTASKAVADQAQSTETGDCQARWLGGCNHTGASVVSGCSRVETRQCQCLSQGVGACCIGCLHIVGTRG
jgi:hypothetical protein